MNIFSGRHRPSLPSPPHLPQPSLRAPASLPFKACQAQVSQSLPLFFFFFKSQPNVFRFQLNACLPFLFALPLLFPFLCLKSCCGDYMRGNKLKALKLQWLCNNGLKCHRDKNSTNMFTFLFRFLFFSTSSLRPYRTKSATRESIYIQV